VSTSKPSSSPIPSDRAGIIDEFGSLDSEIALFSPKVKRHAALKAIIKSWYESLPADASVSVPGARYVVMIGAKANERVLKSVKGAFTALTGAIGVKEAWKLVKLSLTCLEEHLGKSGVEDLVTTERTGNRTITAVPKP
jgi:hypothetical protein